MGIAEDVAAIKARNERVEADKAWETSRARKLIITAATYGTMAVFLSLIGAPNPYVNALVPALAYLLSTLSLPFVKEWWLQNFHQRRSA